jgi:hydroxymethylpyrimidine/phosphomethylpyrimidine kinase
MKGRVLIVAGSDSGGGAGIQADIKAVTALNGFAMTAITALTAQNTQGVHGIHAVESSFIAQQIGVVLDDLGADAVKTGMLHSSEVIETVVAALRGHGDIPLVVDPVMVAKGGASLLEQEAVSSLRDTLLPRATVITPNLPEAAALLDRRVTDGGDMEQAARDLLDLGPAAVLLKGGHLPGDEIVDLLAVRDGAIRTFRGDRVDTPHTHGTGCTLASALAAGLAQGLSLSDAVARARAYTLEAILTAPGYGAGHGPLNHAHTVKDFSAA